MEQDKISILNPLNMDALDANSALCAEDRLMLRVYIHAERSIGVTARDRLLD